MPGIVWAIAAVTKHAVRRWRVNIFIISRVTAEVGMIDSDFL